MRRPPAQWTLREAPPATAPEVEALARRLRTAPVVARLLLQRGLREAGPAEAFLDPRLSSLGAPSALPDMDVAADRLARAVRERERIAVCGDYDVDGMTGTSLLVRFFRLAGADVTWAIPDRDTDGYGLSAAGVERLAADGVRVAVTVDNGVSAFEALERARELGIDVVVTDHHLPGATLPPALAIVNPNRPGAPPPPPGAPCGCALAYKTAWAVAERLRHLLGGEAGVRFKAFLRDAMGLVALATVADVVELVGENRVLVTHGLQALRSSPHAGLAALRESAELGALPLTTRDVGFQLAPRLNAAGRLGRPGLVIELLTCDDPARARELAQQLAQANDERRRIERAVLDQAIPRAEELLQGGERRSLVVHGEGWHKGVIGIVAARLVDLHARPTVVIGFDGASGRGSCRTSPDVDLHEALTASGEHLTRYGGHAMAAGLEIERHAVERFAQRFEEAVREQLGAAPAGQRTLWADLEAHVDDWDLPTAESLQRLAPFGAGNPEPCFLLRGAQVAGQARLIGRESAHLSFALRQRVGAIRVVGFHRAGLYDVAASGAPLDLLVQATVNEFRGTRTPELRLVDARPAAPA
ncbi:MAG: single-stranded-DNA-specific exonuclease RecJ [Planctomycetia bacterium]